MQKIDDKTTGMITLSDLIFAKLKFREFREGRFLDISRELNFADFANDAFLSLFRGF